MARPSKLSISKKVRDKVKEVNPNNTPNGFLARLARKILIDHKYVDQLDFLLNKYLARESDIQNYTLKKKNKTLILRELCSDEMTIKVFLDLIFNILEAEKVTFTVDITMSNGKEFSVSNSIVVPKKQG